MAKEIYIDENGNELLVSGTINNASLLPITSGSATNTKAYIDNGLNGKVNISDICYKSGDTDSVSFAILSGYISNNLTNLEFSFIPDKIIPAGVSISITSLTLTGRSTSGNYFLSNETITGNPSYTVTYSKRGKYINITVAKTSQFSGVTNNTPVSLVATIGYSFT